ncbi:hypothetical protein H6F43_04825 [Leptolyngbya sp. FACHB-36]|uniref:hypothetical protein n=1 Tax=Leptolyngbya sp. FACHB-36 TaxID=2692808 RepID=UPI00168023F1|nr:hypothetical protein [Leptolyngbya sp. FACHB-36]MBD2019508.1 hypothetical protein [Leptolyngbya sp. FACHB-36]
MLVLPSFRESTIAHVINRVYQSGKITRADEHHFLLAMIAEDPLSTEEQSQVRDLIDRLKMGLLRVVD